jgi:hypothetical protein
MALTLGEPPLELIIDQPASSRQPMRFILKSWGLQAAFSGIRLVHGRPPLVEPSITGEGERLQGHFSQLSRNLLQPFFFVYVFNQSLHLLHSLHYLHVGVKYKCFPTILECKESRQEWDES